MNASFDARCLRAAVAAANGKLTEQEVLDAFQRISDHKAALNAAGNLTGRDARLRRFAAEEAERTRIAAAMRRRHAALNVIVRDKIDRQVDGFIADGMKPHRALLAILEGTERGTANARKSVNATRGAYEKAWLGGLMAKFEAEAPHLIGLLRNKEFDADVLREMMQLRKGGNPGVTGNSDAKFVAKTFAEYAELVRTELNRLGASIGKLDGWAGPQMHDDQKLIAAGKDAWVGRTVTLLDLERTFPDGVTSAEAANILGDIYDTIVTGFSNEPSAAEVGKRTSPANMAKALGQHRVLHFKDAEATITYQQEFGYGNTISGMLGYMRNAARIASAMETLGPNPEVMFAAIAKSLARKVKESSTYTPKQKRDYIKALNVQSGALRAGLNVATGAYARPDNVTFAKIGTDIRALESMAKLGGAVISSIGDTVTSAAAAHFRGNNFFTSWGRQVAGVLAGRPKAEAAEIGYLIGEGFDGLIGHITSAHVVNDGPVGFLAGLQQQFFKWNGLTWWTDVNRSVAARTISAEMGMRTAHAFDELPAAYRHVLSTNGIDAAKWEAIRKASLRNVNGRAYVTPDRIRDLPDAAVAPLVADRLLAAKGDPKRTAMILNDARRELQMDVLRFFSEETNYAVIQTDARTRRYMTGGFQAGSLAGEAVRMVMQFKGYPLAFVERVGGRALFGQSKEVGGLARAAHIGQVLAGLTLAGYAAMTAKDVLKGYWPPRDPSDPRSWMAAAQQGGAWGIYGDFLFSQTNRFGGGLLSTLAGPSIGSMADLSQILLNARDYGISAASGDEGKFAAGQALSWAVGNTPFANLFYVKPALDYLFLNSLREAASPGYLRRQSTRRRREYGQELVMPQAMGR